MTGLSPSRAAKGRGAMAGSKASGCVRLRSCGILYTMTPGGLLFLFALTLFLSAFLLFSIQPLIGKMILPLLGGSAEVWTTCMMFFQAMLLLGYGYAHAISSWLGIRRQTFLHLGLLLLPFAFLPIRLPVGWTPPITSNPIPWLLALLALMTGLPLFVASASAPLFQRWFSGTAHPDAGDPYFLYAASNLGSLTALLSYPLLIEPHLHLAHQQKAWALGYGALVILAFGCAIAAWRSPRSSAASTSAFRPPASSALEAPLPLPRCARWVLLSFAPSSLLLGVTAYISTDLAAMPLLWVIPLSLYLLTFALAFAKRPPLPQALTVRALPLAALPVVLLMAANVQGPLWLIPLHLFFFFIAAMACHSELARDRPPPHHLGAFYSWIALGGFLGGGLNALIAPLVFDTIVEYPLLIILVCLLQPSVGHGINRARPLSPAGFASRFAKREAKPQAPGASTPLKTPPEQGRGTGMPWLEHGIAGFRPQHGGKRAPYFCGDAPGASQDEARGGLHRWLDYGLPSLLGAGLIALLLGVRAKGQAYTPLGDGLLFILPALVCYTFRHRPLRFGLGLGVFLAIGLWHGAGWERVRHVERSFFGVHRVMIEFGAPSSYHKLLHGTTVHGKQSLDRTRSGIPLVYYHPSGPAGQIFAAAQARVASLRVAVFGLGAGSLAAYAQAGERWVFYEIDPVVARIAADARYFTFLRDAKTPIAVVLGDARRSVQEAPDRSFDLIVLDAFSSDALPTHLFTREALQLYLTKLSEGGWLAFHLSNRYFRLEPTLGNLAADAGLSCLAQNHQPKFDTPAEELEKSASHWLVMARRPSDLQALERYQRWQVAERQPGSALWSDDFSGILNTVRWSWK